MPSGVLILGNVAQYEGALKRSLDRGSGSHWASSIVLTNKIARRRLCSRAERVIVAGIGIGSDSMKFFIGLFGVIGSVLGGYVLSGGFLIQLYHPPELMIIAGGAIFALVIGSSMDTIKGIGRDFKFVLRGTKFKGENYLELFSFLYLLFDKGRRSGMLALEDDVDRPEDSEIWQQFPAILHNHHVKDFVCDILRIKILGNLNVHEIEALMDIELDTHHHEALQPSGAMQSMADGLPAFGIVAAVMGVVITMGFISEPPEVSGNEGWCGIGRNLCGGFIGLWLCRTDCECVEKCCRGRRRLSDLYQNLPDCRYPRLSAQYGPGIRT